MNPSRVRKTTILCLFIGVLACYVSLSPGAIAGMGYTGEEIQSGERILTIADALRKGVSVPPMLWSRHGPLPLLIDLPFLTLGKLVLSMDYVLSFEPVLLTALLVTVLFAWLRTLTSPAMSLLLALIGAFGTMLWPYAYIGMETKQSLLLLLAGYLVLTGRGLHNWSITIAFALVAAFAVSVKSTGIVLVPAIAWLIYTEYKEIWRSRRAQIATVLVTIATIWILAAWGRAAYWAPHGGGFRMLRPWLIHSPLTFFTNCIGIFGSPSKGLFVYAPVLLLSIYAIPQALRSRHRRTTVFVLLLVGGIVVELAMLRVFADEVWGSRYLHASIAPLLLCIGATRPNFQWRKQLALLLLATSGAAISFLGAFYYYGLPLLAGAKTGQNTIEWLTSDSVWNPVEFHARLFRTWVEGGTAPVLWSPKHAWAYQPPPDAQPWKSVDLRELCAPQALMLRLWSAPKDGRTLGFFIFHFAALVVGLLSLIAATVSTRLERQIQAPSVLTPALPRAELPKAAASP